MTPAVTRERAEPVRILHAVDSLAGGGTALVSATLIEQTAGRFQHAVCSLRGAGPTASGVGSLTVPITYLGKRGGHDWGLALRIARLCRRLRPQVVHARNWGTIDAVIGARLAGVPVVIQSEHGRALSDLEGLHRRRIQVRRLLAPWIDAHVVVSTHLQRWLIEQVGIGAAKVTLVRNGVDVVRFKPLLERDRIRQQLGYAPSDLVFGAVGRLDPVKDHRTLLEAFSIVASRHRRSRLIIVGEGPERRALEEVVRRRGLADSVRLVGQREDVPQWLGIADVFVQPSLMEGMCNALLEAMAVGLPVVATRVGGNPEIVEHGVSGLLVAPADPNALGAAMISYGADDLARVTHGAAGRERAEQHYPLAKMLAGYTEVYDGALARRAKAVEAYANRATRA